jgi:hypothetical protein
LEGDWVSAMTRAGYARRSSTEFDENLADAHFSFHVDDDRPAFTISQDGFPMGLFTAFSLCEHILDTRRSLKLWLIGPFKFCMQENAGARPLCRRVAKSFH